MTANNDVLKRCKNNVVPFLLWLCCSAVLVAADQISKALVSAYLPKGETVTVIPHLIDFVYVENRGAAWGMLADKRFVFIIISVAAIIVVAAVLLYTARGRKMLNIPLLLVLSGGIGNMIDRIGNGFVVDFIQFDFFKSFPVFNVADCYVTIGGALVLVYVLFIDRNLFSDKKKEKNEGTENGDGN